MDEANGFSEKRHSKSKRSLSGKNGKKWKKKGREKYIGVSATCCMEGGTEQAGDKDLTSVSLTSVQLAMWVRAKLWLHFR